MDKAQVLAYVRERGAALEHASVALQVRGCIGSWILSMASQHVLFGLASSEGQHAAPAADRFHRLVRHVQDDPEVVLASVAQDGNALQFASAGMQRDKSVVLAAVRQHGDALGIATAEMQADKEVVLAAVAQDPDSLLYAAAALKSDRDVVLEVVKQDGSALNYATPELQRCAATASRLLNACCLHATARCTAVCASV